MLRLIGRVCRSAGTVKSVEGHRPPSNTQTASSRYSGVFFTHASKSQKLDVARADLENLSELIKAPRIADFLTNISHTRDEQREVISGLASCVDTMTLDFLNTLIENRKLNLLPEIVREFGEYFRALNREESIRVISAHPLSEAQKTALEETVRRKLAGGSFTVEYSVDPVLLGGFHIYFGDRFLDCSLATRAAALRSELQRLSF